MNYYLILVVKIVIAIALAIVLGNGVVVVFNRIPANWFEDDGKLPTSLVEAGASGRQRLPSTPWKYVFTGYFLMSGIFIGIREGWQYEVAAVITLAIVLLMAICDYKYMVVPDQLQICLAVSAIGFISFYHDWWEQLAGAGIGLIIGLVLYGIGRLIYKADVIGGADLKFFITMGLVAGRVGIVWIFILSSFAMAINVTYLLITKKAKKTDRRALIPNAFIATTIYFLFIWYHTELLTVF